MKKIMFNDKKDVRDDIPIKFPQKSHPNKSFKDLTGKKFGKLTVICKEYTDKNRNIHWKCKCECGNTAIVRGRALKNGNTKSCGCLIYESKNVKHGMKRTRLYNIWSGIKSRCYAKTNPAYNRYGGRGISMCEEWRGDFMAFYNWAMANGYAKGLSIDRIDVNGNYEPCNCRWATAKEQSDNKRCNILITIGNETLDLQQWCDKIGIKRSTVNTRVRMCGWSYEQALTTPIRAHKIYKERLKSVCIRL